MMTLPLEWELVEFFGVAPTLLDAGVPWAYNTVTFEEGDWSVTLMPGLEEVRLRVRQEKILVALELDAIAELRIVRGSQREWLEAVERVRAPGLPGRSWRIELRPSVRISRALYLGDA